MAEGLRYLPPRERREFARMYPNMPTAEVARRLRLTEKQAYYVANKLGVRKDAAFLSSAASGRLQSGTSAGNLKRFAPGHKPWNTWVRGVCGVHQNSRRHQFRKGHKGGRALENEQPIGAERVVDNYLQRKVNNDRPFHRRWKAVHVLVWEAAHGSVPAGHVVAFKPGQHSTNADRITLEVLELVSRSELCRRNSYHNRYPKEVASLIQMRGQLTRRINRVSRRHS